MTNLRLNRYTKTSASSCNEIVKRDRKSRVKKINEDKVSASRNSSMFTKFRAFVSEFEFQFDSQSQSEFVVDSFTVASVAFVAFVASVSIDNATLLKVLLQLLSSSSDAIFSSIDFVAIFVTNSSLIDFVATFVAFVIASIVIFEMIEIVDDSNMNDIDVLLKKYDCTQTKLLRNDFDAHDKNRVQKKIQIYDNVSSLSFSVFARFTRVASSVITSRISRISTKRRFKILIVSKIDEFSRDSRDVMNDDDNEKSDVKNDNRSNCIQCCRISINCRYVANIVCDKCFKQKTICISIRFKFVY